MHEKLLTRMLRVSRYASRGVFLQILLVTLSVGVATAQVTVSGKLTAQDAPDGLPGVNILEKGTTNGIVTDANGSYKIVFSSVNSTLVFSSFGYASQEVSVNGRTTIDVSLTTDLTELQEVVVVGYGE